MNLFPWARAMEIGFGRLRLAPDQFWRMTLPELAAAARHSRPDGSGVMTGGELVALMGRFPDSLRSQTERGDHEQEAV